VYFGGALVLSGGFFATALHAAMHVTPGNARLLFRASLVFLPILLLLMSADRVL
jgi:heme O synthase-like polyprenyltransferase